VNRSGLLVTAWRWARTYLVALLLVVGLGVSCARTLLEDIGPRPQHPPPGYALSRTQVQLQWSTGNRSGEIRVQVSTDAAFGELLVDEVPAKNTRDLEGLRPGRTYYWRLVQRGRTGSAASFEVSPTALRYR
jgi:hypothetical protein